MQEARWSWGNDLRGGNVQWPMNLDVKAAWARCLTTSKCSRLVV